MDHNLNQPYNEINLDIAYLAEEHINSFRNQLRNQHLEAIKTGAYTYQAGTAYSGMYALYEKIGDYVINVSETIDIENSQKNLEYNMIKNK